MYQERVTQFWDICSINTESRVCRIWDITNADNHFATP